jgi:hypothetical protein
MQNNLNYKILTLIKIKLSIKLFYWAAYFDDFYIYSLNKL